MPRDEVPAEFVLVPARVIDDHGDELVVEIEAFRSRNRMFVKRKDVINRGATHGSVRE